MLKIKRILLGREPTWLEVFMLTHLNAESKKRYFQGDRTNLRFCSQTSKEAHDAYLKALCEKYGEDPTKHVDDPELWTHTQLMRQEGRAKGDVYGIGTSDPHYVVTGSFSSGSSQASDSAQQEEIERLRAQVSSLQETQTTMLENQAQRELEMQNRTAALEAQMPAFFNQYRPEIPPSNPPSNPPK